MNRRIGRIVISPELLAELLDYHGGVVVQAVWSDAELGLVLFIEHPDMPEMVEGVDVKNVRPVYDTTVRLTGGLVLRRTERRNEADM